MSSETSNNSMENSAGTADASIDAMIDDVARMMERDPHTARSAAADALALAEQSGNSRLVARALRAVGNTLFFTGENESALQHIEQSYRVSEGIGFTTGMIESLLSRSNMYSNMGRQAEAIAAATQGIQLCTATGNNIVLAKLRNTLGLIYTDTGNYQAALNLHLDNINLRTQIGDTEQLAVSLGNIASIYLYFNDLDLCLDANLRALEAYRVLGTNRLGEATTLFNLCNCLIHRGDYDAAWARCDELHRILGDSGPASYRFRVLQLRATLLGFRDENKAALALITSALELAEQYDMQPEIGIIRVVAAKFRIRLKEFQQALHELHPAMEIAEQTGNRRLYGEIVRMMAQCHEMLGNHADAVSLLNRHIEVYAEVFSEEKQKAIADLEVRYRTEQAEREREIFRLEKEKLELENAAKQQELTMLAVSLTQKNEMLEKLRHDLERIFTSEDRAANALASGILESLRAGSSTDDWEAFERQFQLMHPAFIRTLSERYPELTPTELRICALLKINLSTKQIASMLCVSTRSVEGHRYNIRRKLDLRTSGSLATFLAAV